MCVCVCHFTRYNNGIVLVTGPTGSGKSSTLAAMLDEINTQAYDHILTIEDPIEFTHSSKNLLINQREVRRDTLSFANALRVALREDPDVILVGELRDLETKRLALIAAETGHLVPNRMCYGNTVIIIKIIITDNSNNNNNNNNNSVP